MISPSAASRESFTSLAQVDYSAAAANGAGAEPAPATLFHKLLTEEEHGQTRAAALLRIDAELTAARQLAPNEHDGWSLDFDVVQQWRTAIIRWRQWAYTALPAFPVVLPTRDWRTLLASYAPIALVEGCWLQFASGPATSHTRISSELLRSHSLYAGYGSPTSSLGNRYRDLLRSLDVALPELGTWELASDPRIAAAAWRMSEFELALSLYPQRHLPELLGYHLFKAAYGLCPLIESGYFPLSAEGAATAYFDFHRSTQTRSELCEAALNAIQAYLGERGTPDALDAARGRIQQGIEVAKMLTEHWLAFATRLLASDAFSPAAQMQALIRSKARHALGYHRLPRLNGRSVDSYLGTAQPEAVLDALAQSPYIRPGSAATSPFLTRLVAFGGPMFRIFSPEELDVIARWIDSLQPDAAGTDNRGPDLPEVKFRDASVSPAGTALPDPVETRHPTSASLPLRELYYRLLHVESFPDVLPHAAVFAERWLVRARSGLYRDERRLPFSHYSPHELAQWLDRKHESQVASYSGAPAGASGSSREDLIDESLQLCPMVFIDGAWLRWASAVQISHTPLGALLYQIYADELGNGDSKKNHPNVYRELMTQMGVQLPEFPSREFAWWDGFEDASFEVPTFWLALAHFPNRFLPELLGLNLAMELSGVGGSYRTAGDQLRAHGFSTAFVDLHNTIDNVSTGHTAHALKAITLHMDEIRRTGGPSQVQQHWLRVWTGYRALKPPTGLAGRVRWTCHRLLARSLPARSRRH